MFLIRLQKRSQYIRKIVIHIILSSRVIEMNRKKEVASTKLSLVEEYAMKCRNSNIINISTETGEESPGNNSNKKQLVNNCEVVNFFFKFNRVSKLCFLLSLVYCLALITENNQVKAEMSDIVKVCTAREIKDAINEVCMYMKRRAIYPNSRISKRRNQDVISEFNTSIDNNISPIILTVYLFNQFPLMTF